MRLAGRKVLQLKPVVRRDRNGVLGSEPRQLLRVVLAHVVPLLVEVKDDYLFQAGRLDISLEVRLLVDVHEEFQREVVLLEQHAAVSCPEKHVHVRHVFDDDGQD